MLIATLIGSVAFITYAGMPGVQLPATTMQTGDADLAQDFAISAEVQDSLPPILEIRQSVDPQCRAAGIVSGLSRSPRNGIDALKTTLGSDIVESLLRK